MSNGVYPIEIEVQAPECKHGTWNETAYCDWHVDDRIRTRPFCATNGQERPIEIREKQLT